MIALVVVNPTNIRWPPHVNEIHICKQVVYCFNLISFSSYDVGLQGYWCLFWV